MSEWTILHVLLGETKELLWQYVLFHEVSPLWGFPSIDPAGMDLLFSYALLMPMPADQPNKAGARMENVTNCAVGRTDGVGG